MEVRVLVFHCKRKKLQVKNHKRVTSNKLHVTTNNLQATKLQVTITNYVK